MQIATVFSRFWRDRLNWELSDSEVALFFAILAEINRTRGENNNLLESKISIGTPKLELLAGMSRAEVYRARNRLKQYGLIDFVSGKGKKKYATYFLGDEFKKVSHIDIESETVNKVSQYETENVTVSETVSVTLPETVSETRYKNIEYREENKENKREYIVPQQVEGPPQTPYQKIIELYHTYCPSLPKVRVLNETRKKYIRARWKEHPDLKFWENYFKSVEESDFLTGRANYGNRNPFIADLEWLMRPNNFAKVIEGKYKNRGYVGTIDEEIKSLLGR
ncbi:hypothetical protein [Marinitoga sp. 1137]|uniref:hypothetical protein n=1 Tax=Marinitoga sp. 1137 TaxID=1545835 RepID=UPI00095333F5|nr:hypothetical protein [Marinitoga sp. 1137]